MTLSQLSGNHGCLSLSCCCHPQVWSGNYKFCCACTKVLWGFFLFSLPDLCPVDVLYRCGRFLRMASSLPCLSRWWCWRATPSVLASSHGTQQLAMSFLVQVKRNLLGPESCPRSNTRHCRARHNRRSAGPGPVKVHPGKVDWLVSLKLVFFVIFNVFWDGLLKFRSSIM